MGHLSRENLISCAQYAYRERHSSVGMLLGITDTIREHLNENRDCVMVSIDLSKAFDRLDHNILIRKLMEKYNFSIMACRLMNSYLRGRSQFVKLQDLVSDVIPVYYGVPQGSIIGPILFLLYLNDCVDCLDLTQVKPFIYADDIQLLFSKPKEFSDVLENVVNFNLQQLYDWMTLNSFTINANKTKAIMFRRPCGNIVYPRIKICDDYVSYVQSIKCLGVILDQFLNFDDHIDYISSRVSYGLRRLYNSGLHLPLKVKYMLAHTLLLSHLNYCIEVVSGTFSYNIDKMKLIVNRIVRFVYGKSYRDRISYYVRTFLGCSFENFIRLRNLFFFYKIMKYRIPRYLSDKFSFTRSTRNPQVIIPRITYSVFERSFIVTTARSWNSLPVNLRSFSGSCELFRSRILTHFRDA